MQPPVAGGTDAVRALAPVLCLVAGVLLALRILPPLLGAGDRAAGRSRALVLPLAAVEAARRPQATAGALIVALGTASGTFALATLATWDRTQHAQADLRVGTDLAVALAVPARLGDGAAVERATGGTVSPATRRPVPVGQWVGEPGEPPELVAVDTARAGRLLRGTLPEGRTWTGVGAALAPVDRVAGAPLDPGSVPTLRGTVSGGAPLRAVPRLVLQDAAGLRVADEAAAGSGSTAGRTRWPSPSRFLRARTSSRSTSCWTSTPPHRGARAPGPTPRPTPAPSRSSCGCRGRPRAARAAPGRRAPRPTPSKAPTRRASGPPRSACWPRTPTCPVRPSCG